MKKNFIAACLLLAFITVSAAGFAQTKTPRIHKRQENQQKRIAQGVKSGELTAKETEHLEAREAKIQSDKKEAKADGKVTAKERVKLTREENRTSRAIHRQKHDAQVRH
jgi:hypothetical protein